MKEVKNEIKNKDDNLYNIEIHISEEIKFIAKYNNLIQNDNISFPWNISLKLVVLPILIVFMEDCSFEN